MLHRFGSSGAKLITSGNTSSLSSEFVWLDAFQPTREEERLITTTLGVDIPTREEMLEIEASNRLREEHTNGGSPTFYLTTTLVSRADSASPEASPVTFILSGNRLITLRHGEFMAFRTFIADFQRDPAAYKTADRVFSGISDRIVERLADILERVGFEAEEVSAEIFRRRIDTQTRQKSGKPINLRHTLHRVGNIGSLDAKTRESIVSMSRLLSFLNDARSAGFATESRLAIQSARADLTALAEHSYFLADKITFLLDAVLGLINLSQNEIIQVFSIAAVMFMPPTLIASIYGMNFHRLPELTWQHGYEYALLLMLLSALIPWLFFKKKGWL